MDCYTDPSGEAAGTALNCVIHARPLPSLR
jgi:hypothetical protein